MTQVQALPKLVRDRIPEIIRCRGAIPTITILAREDLYPRLLEKLHEELAEFEASPCAEELADIYEVLRMINSILNISSEELERVRERKYQERGGFEGGILLERIEEP
ncbi:MAG TPA: nucleoside triphosphate pyrophosphohydrolase [Pyrinomonadaceae bacterium]|nr:nucleoside triphosphate pyrophosphohydrolase [Pyrinomonadaceae bacterium]